VTMCYTTEDAKHDCAKNPLDIQLLS